jgi:hypothetical protein
LLPKHQFISTLTAEDLNTHERVDQHYRGVPLQDLMAASVEILLDEYEKQGDAFKGWQLISFDVKCVPMLIVLLSTLPSHVLSPNRKSRRFAL